MAHAIKVIEPRPGINDDLTDFESPNYIDGQHVRFYGEKGLPLKMGGYQLIDPGTTEIIRNLYMIEKQNSFDLYYGRPSSLRVTNYTDQGVSGSTTDRTPIGFVPDPNNTWSFDQTTVLDPSGAFDSYIIATATPNGNDLNNSTLGTIFWGPVNFKPVNGYAPLIPLLSTVGAVQLNSGTPVFVPMDSITEDAVIITSINTPNNSTPGYPYSYDILPGIGFYINSSAGTSDNSLVNYQVLQTTTELIGTISLVSGAATVSSLAIRNDSLVLLSYNTPDSNTGHLGNLYIDNIVPGTSFDILSDNSLDTSSVNYSVITFPNIFEGSSTLVPTAGGSTVTINIGGVPGLNIFNTSLVFVNHETTGGTMGKLYVQSSDIDPAVSFQVRSTSPTDSSTVTWSIYNYPSTSGGIVSVGGGAYLFSFGNNGSVEWSTNANPTIFPDQNQAIIASNKIVQGLPIRSGGVPGVLFWSLDTLIRGLSSPTTEDPDNFTFDIIEDNISILSPECVVKYQSQFFWIGTDQFYQFDGVVQKIVNNMCTNFFFDNVNRAATEKVFGFVNPKYSEITWGWPMFPSTENTHQTIYNYGLKTWYTTELPRSIGIAATSTFAYPIMADNTTMPLIDVPPPPGFPPAEVYGLWMHEFGWDRVQNGQSYSIPSWFETNVITLMDDNPGNDRNIRIRRIEPDFKNQVGDMTLTVNMRQFANDVILSSEPYIFNSSTSKIDMEEEAGLVSFLFESNTLGGRYYMGKVLIEYMPGDPRVQD